MRLVLATLGALVLFPLPIQAQPPSDQEPEIVRRSVQHHGGDLYHSSETSFELCSKSGCFSVTTRMDEGVFRHTVQEAQGDRRRWVESTNDAVLLREFGKTIEVPQGDEQRWRDWVMARVYFALLPFRLEDPSVRFQDLGTTNWNGRPLHRIKVTFESGTSSDASDEFLYWFDPSTARLEQFAYTYINRDGSRGLRFRELHNHRRIGGLLVFDQHNLGREDHALALEAISYETSQSELREVSEVYLANLNVEPLD